MGKHRTSNKANGRVFDLEDRLLEFASVVIDISEKLPSTRAGNHVAGQLLRSGTSPYSNHGEAESAESADDFVHKMKVCLKELRETRRWLRLIHRKNWLGDHSLLKRAAGEVEELNPNLCRQHPHGEAKSTSGEFRGNQVGHSKVKHFDVRR